MSSAIPKNHKTMSRFLLVFLVLSELLVAASEASGLPTRASAPKVSVASKKSPLEPKPVAAGFHVFMGGLLYKRIAEKLFDEADTNQDGSISTTEAYELVLHLYIQVNRKAPVPPPPRETVNALFEKADVSKTGRLNRDEFTTLATVLVSRALTRLVAHKIVSYAVAPMLALEVVERMRDNQDWSESVTSSKLPSKMKDLAVNPTFWKTALTVVFVKSLGNIVIGAVTFCLNSIQLKKKDDN